MTNADFSSTDGWTPYVSGGFRDYGYGLIGTYKVYNDFSPATVDETHLNTEYCFGLECRWENNYASYNQTISELPAGKYTLTYDVENVNGATTAASYNNLFYVEADGKKYLDESTEWMNKGKSNWTTHTQSFTLTAASTAIISLGYGTGSNKYGVNNTPAIYVSHLKLMYENINGDVLDRLIAQAKSLNSKFGTLDEVIASATAVLEAIDNTPAYQATIDGSINTLSSAINTAITSYNYADSGDDLTCFIVNNGFEASEASTGNIGTTIRKDYYSSSWQLISEGGNSASAVLAYGVEGNQINLAQIPSVDNNGNGGKALGISIGWNTTITYQSYPAVTLPAGVYTLKVNAYNAGTATLFNSKFGFVPTSGEAKLSSKTSFELNAWETDEVTFTLDEVTEGRIQIGGTATGTTSTNHGKIFFDNVTLTYRNPLNHAKLEWNKALTDADNVIKSDDYMNVVGTERVALQTEIGKDEPTTVEGYNEAIENLNSAVATFIAAKTNYDALVAEIAHAKTLGMDAETVDSYAANSESTATTVLVSTQNLKVAEYTYITGTYTVNSKLETWTKDFANNPNTEGYVPNGPTYWDEWNNSRVTRTANQTVTLPAGDYAISAIGRGADGSSGYLYYKIGDADPVSVDFLMKGSSGRGVDTSGAANFAEDGKYNPENEGYGWEYRFLTFTLEKETEVTLGVSATLDKWASIYAPQLLTTKATVKSMALDLIKLAENKAADDEEAVAVGKLEDAIEAAKAVVNNDDVTGNEINDAMTALQAAIDQFDADNADQEADQTAKVATNGWKKFETNNAAGVCDTKFAPAITTFDGRTANLAEVYEGTVNTTGQIIYQDITGLPNGSYKVGFYGNAFYTSGRGFNSDMEDGAEDVAYVFANEKQAFITAHIATETTKNDFREFEVEVTDGTIKLGMGKAKPGTNWHTMQIYRLTWFTTAKILWATAKSELQEVIDAAETLMANPYKTKEREALTAAIEEAKAAKTSNKLNAKEVADAKAVLQTALETFRVANYAEIAEGAIYLKNVGTGEYLAAGANWGSRAIVNEIGLDYTSALSSGKYTLDSKVSNGGNNHFFSNGLFNDAGIYSWVFEQVSEDSYTIGDGGTRYLTVDENKFVQFTETIDDNAKWQVVTADDRLATAIAKDNAPADVSFLIQGYSFSRNDTRNNGWSREHEGGTEQFVQPGGDKSNYGCEYKDNTFEIYQTLNVPNGTYTFSIAGFGTNGTTVIYANDDEKPFTHTEVINEEENDFEAQLALIASGSYEGNSVTTTVFNHTLKIGIKRTENSDADRTVFDNARLTYEGPIDLSALISGYETALANAKTAAAKEDRMSSAVKTAIAAAIDTYDTGKVDEESQDALKAAIDALTTVTANVNASINSYKILEAGFITDNSLEGWICENENAFHVNTWSTEGNNDGTGMTVPFIENWVANGNLLGAGEVYYTLPFVDPGTYKVSALVRIYSEAGKEPSGASWFVGNKESDVTEGISFTYGSKSKGIYNNYVTIGEADEQGALKFGIRIDESRNFNWIAFKNVRIEEVTVATAEDYEALNAAIAASEAKTLGFDKDEYAPYMNVAVLETLSDAKAIDQSDDNDQIKVRELTNTLNDGWTVNTEDMDAIYNGMFATVAEGANYPDGWTRTNGWGAMQSNIGGDYPTAYYNQPGSLKYGNQGVYTMPLKANTVYQLTVTYRSHENNSNRSMTVSVLNGEEGLTATKFEGNGSTSNWIVKTKLFRTGEAGNYVLTLANEGNTWMTNVSLVKAVIEDVEIAENVDYTPIEKYANVTFNRTLVEGWNGLVLPFDMTVEDVKTTFAAGKVKDFTGISYEEATGVTLKFADFAEETTVIPAGRPFMVKAIAGTSYEIDDVILPATGLKNIEQTAEGYDNIKYVMKGTYAAETDLTDVSFALINGNNFFYHYAGRNASSAKAFRAYFENASENPAAARVSFAFDDEEGTTTAITEVNQPTKAEGTYYDLQGRKVDSVKRKGIYILNGRKVVK